MNDHDKQSNMPTILVVLLALFGYSILPQGQGGRGGGPAGQPATSSAPAQGGGRGASADDEEGSKDDDPMELLKEHRKGEYPQGRELEEGLKGEEACDLRFLIVTVPDPRETSVSHEFDSTIAAVLRAVESENYVLERRKFSREPDSQAKPDASPSLSIGQWSGFALALTLGKSTDRDRAWSGSILCRHVGGTNDKKGLEGTNSGDGADQLLMLLLVPETPAWGIDKKQLKHAIDLVNRHQNCPGNAGDRIHIVGPMYSGSFASLARVIQTAQKNVGGLNLKYKIINGSAQSPPDETIQKVFERRLSHIRRTRQLSSARLSTPESN